MNNAEDSKKMVAIPENALLALVANQLKDVALFPEKLEDAKEYLKKAKIKTV
ncbi:hypothetical protein ACX0G9_04760 [Flavitalea flava]